MKTEFTNKGWKEITTKNINIDTSKIPQKPFMIIEEWMDFNEKNPKIGKRRLKCHCCCKKWELTNSIHVWLFFTDKGNKTVCDSCAEKLLNTILNENL